MCSNLEIIFVQSMGLLDPTLSIFLILLFCIYIFLILFWKYLIIIAYFFLLDSMTLKLFDLILTVENFPCLDFPPQISFFLSYVHSHYFPGQ